MVAAKVCNAQKTLILPFSYKLPIDTDFREVQAAVQKVVRRLPEAQGLAK